MSRSIALSYFASLLLIASPIAAHAAIEISPTPPPAPQPACLVQNTGCSSTINDIMMQLPAANTAESLAKLRVDVAANLSSTHSMDDKEYLQDVLNWIDRSLVMIQNNTKTVPDIPTAGSVTGNSGVKVITP